MKKFGHIIFFIFLASPLASNSVRAEDGNSSLEALWVTGDSLMALGKYRESEKIARKVAEEAKKIHDDDMLMNAYSTLMIDYQFIGDFDKAAKCGTLCLDFDRKSGDSVNISTSLNNMAGLYYNMKQPEKALPYAIEAMQIAKALDPNSQMLARRYGRLAEISHALGKYKEGLQYARMALAIDEKLGDSVKMAFRKCQMADNLRELDSIEKARELYEESVPLFIKGDVSHSLAVTYYDLGLIYGQMGKEEKSKEYLQMAFQVVQQTGDNLMVQRVYDELVLYAIKNGLVPL